MTRDSNSNSDESSSNWQRVNAENAVRQSSRDSAINNNDNNFVT